MNKEDLFKVLEEKEADKKWGGTSLSGHLKATYNHLIKFVGKPTYPNGSDNYKTDVEWVIEFPNGAIMTIYNWKNGKNYNGKEGLEIEEITDWNIGTKGNIEAYQKAFMRIIEANEQKL